MYICQRRAYWKTVSKAVSDSNQLNSTGQLSDHNTWCTEVTQLTSWVTTTLDAQRSLSWSVEWPLFIKCCGHSIDQLSDHGTWCTVVTQLVSWVTVVHQVLWSLNWPAEWPQHLMHRGHSAGQLSDRCAVWFSLTKTKTKMVKNEKITNSLTKTKTKTKKWWKLKWN